jgi:hypothetical protein
VRYLSDNFTWSADAPAKWLWAVTLANTVVTSLLLAFIYEAIRSLFGFATLHFVTPWRVLPLVGIALSIAGFRLTKSGVSTSLGVAHIINWFLFAFYLLIILGLAALWLFSGGLVGKLSDMH